MSTALDRLKPQEKKIVAALVEAKTIKGAAKLLGMEEGSLHKRLQYNPLIQRAWDEVCFNAVRDACAILAGFSVEAATLLVDGIRGDAPLSNTTLRALESVLDRATEYLRQRKLEDEIAALKAALQDRGIMPDGEVASSPGTRASDAQGGVDPHRIDGPTAGQVP